MIGTKRFFWILLMVSLAGCVDKSRDLIPSLLAMMTILQIVKKLMMVSMMTALLLKMML